MSPKMLRAQAGVLRARALPVAVKAIEQRARDVEARSNHWSGGFPAIVEDSVDLTAGSTQGFDTAALENVFRTAMLVDEVRITVRGLYASLSQTAAQRVNLAAGINMSLRLGSYDMTRGVVPAWLLGTQQQGLRETSHFNEAIGYLSSTSYTLISRIRWKLPKPLFVPQGGAIAATASRAAIVSTTDGLPTTTNVSVAYAGRVLGDSEAVPKVISVPYVTASKHPIAQTTSVSGEKELFNPFQQNLRVQRLSGRLLRMQDYGGTLYPVEDFASGLESGGTASNNVRVKLTDSYARDIVRRDAAPFYQVLDVARRAWTFGAELRHGERYIANVTGVPSNRQPQIALIGWREEVLQ